MSPCTYYRVQRGEAEITAISTDWAMPGPFRDSFYKQPYKQPYCITFVTILENPKPNVLGGISFGFKDVRFGLLVGGDKL